MKKYDCTRALDYNHEILRMCHSYPNGCENSCPFEDMDCNDITEEHIRMVQQWSDEHPEMPTITKDERLFLECFRIAEDKYIMRTSPNDLILRFGATSMALWPTMFSFIKMNEEWSIEELLKLEVRDDN